MRVPVKPIKRAGSGGYSSSYSDKSCLNQRDAKMMFHNSEITNVEATLKKHYGGTSLSSIQEAPDAVPPELHGRFDYCL